jgi:hypothetical protein
MRRREFVDLLGDAAVAWPLGVRAQQPATPVIGFVDSRSASESATHVTARAVRVLPDPHHNAPRRPARPELSLAAVGGGRSSLFPRTASTPRCGFSGKELVDSGRCPRRPASRPSRLLCLAGLTFRARDLLAKLLGPARHGRAMQGAWTPAPHPWGTNLQHLAGVRSDPGERAFSRRA